MGVRILVDGCFTRFLPKNARRWSTIKEKGAARGVPKPCSTTERFIGNAAAVLFNAEGPAASP